MTEGAGVTTISIRLIRLDPTVYHWCTKCDPPSQPNSIVNCKSCNRAVDAIHTTQCPVAYSMATPRLRIMARRLPLRLPSEVGRPTACRPTAAVTIAPSRLADAHRTYSDSHNDHPANPVLHDAGTNSRTADVRVYVSRWNCGWAGLRLLGDDVQSATTGSTMASSDRIAALVSAIESHPRAPFTATVQ